MDKKQPNKSGRLSAAQQQQQQLAMLQQLGALDPSMLGYGMPGCFDPAQLLNPLISAQYSMMNPAALQQAFAGGGGRNSQGTPGGADWLSMMQNQALAAGLGAGYLPGMMPGYMPPTELSNQHKALMAGSSKSKEEFKRIHETTSPRSDSRSPVVGRIQHERNHSHESHSSKERPESRHSLNSPHRPSNSKHHDSKSSLPSWMNNNANKASEQSFQMELLRQFEQQIMMQQLQIQQQQQQQQINAALESFASMQGKANGPSRKDTGETQRAQDQLNAMMAQLIQSGGMQGMSPAVSALLAQPGALDTVLAMSQMAGNTGSMPGHSRSNKESRDQKPGTSSQNDSPNTSSHSSHKHFNSPGISKSRESSTPPRNASKMQAPISIPGLSPTLAAGLSPDQAMLAMLYSQQLQYDEYLKEQLSASTKGNHSHKYQDGHEMAHSSKRDRHRDNASPRYHRPAQHSPAPTSVSKDQSRLSPAAMPVSKEQSRHSPPRKSNDRDHGHGKSPNASIKQSAPPKSRDQENMSDTLKLLSTLASNPNLSQREIAALLSFPTNVDPSMVLAGLGPSAASLVRSGRRDNLEDLNKTLSDALDRERRKFNEQIKAGIEREMAADRSANQISVIHQNKAKTQGENDRTVSSNASENNYNKKSSTDGTSDIPKHSAQTEAVSSDGDKPEVNTAEKHVAVSLGRSTRPRIPIDDEVLAPINHGWKREIRFKPFGGQLRGEVVYTAPDGRKLRMYADVVKYLDENNITQLTRSNFSFSTRLRLGTLLERKDCKDGSREWVEVTEEDLELDRAAVASPYTDGSDRKEKEQEREKQKEQMRLLKEQEIRRFEQQRIEREIRERLAYEELERQRIAEEQRRQHMLLMRALESQKRAEERERRREEIRIEKMIQREKKMEQKRIAMQIARELKMPVEDMAAIGAPDLPELTRLQGTYDNKCPHQLSGNMCADVLMVLEFVETFKECLRIDDGALPTFEQLQLGLLNDPERTDDLVKLTIALLHQCLCDPGVPAPGPWLHCLTGVKVTDIDVSEDNYSEILRLFIWARSGYKTEIAMKLETLSFLSLSADEKTTSLAFLVNELVCSRPICMEIEKNLDTIATLKRDKWIVEGQMRQLRVAYEKNPGSESAPPEDDGASTTSAKSANAAEDGAEGGEDNAESTFQKKMEELTQQHNSYNTQLVCNAKPLRALDLGQDRYKRRYWVLPHLGGVYVEGLESGISYEDDDESPDENEDSEEDENEEEEGSPKGDDQNKEDSEIILAEKQNSDCDSRMETTEADELTSESKSLDDPTASSKDIAKVLMMLSREPVNHESKAPGHVPPAEDKLLNSVNGMPENEDSPTRAALEAVSALNAMKANCETKGMTPGGSERSATVNQTCRAGPKSPDLSDEVVAAAKAVAAKAVASTSHLLCPKNDCAADTKSKKWYLTSQPSSKSPDPNDGVVEAAKAVAAKAVASTSHLLYPKTENTANSIAKAEKPGDSKTQPHDDGGNGTMPIGKHTINALVQMGVDPAALSSQQLEALSHLDIPTSPQDEHRVKEEVSDDVKPETESDQKSEDAVADDENLAKSDDTPMDLTKSMSADASEKTNGVKPFPIKRDALQASSDVKAVENKFFVPIPCTNGEKTNVKTEQEQYNQIVYSCPSPSILANFIISSANFGQLPPLDGIKFPIRPPDVKEEPDAIPREHKRGWWRIESESELRNLSEKLHMRGIREKQLHKNITKNFEFCASSMSDALKPEHRFAVLTKDPAADTDGNSEDTTENSKTKKSTRVQNHKEKRSDDIPSRLLNSEALAFQVEMDTLRQVEELATRCINMAILTPQWKTEDAKPSISRKDLEHVPIGPLRDSTGAEIKFDIANPILHDPKSALGTAVNLLGSLERAVCRRYLKWPLVRKGGASEFSSLPSLSESGALDVAAGLRTWRTAVVSSTSASQLSLCVRMLDSCIAWNRSAHALTPVSQQSESIEDSPSSGNKSKKRKSEKKPASKSATKPDGPATKKRKKKTPPPASSPAKAKKVKRMPIDTADVISKSQGPEESRANGFANCDDTFDGSFDGAADESTNTTDGDRPDSDFRNTNDTDSPRSVRRDCDNASDEYKPRSEVKKKKKKKKIARDGQGEPAAKKPSKPRKKSDGDVKICREVLRELQSHEDATCFLFPVDCKLVPGYRKIIKRPIDFHTIESRLKRGRYKSKEEFVSEVRLVFDNCQKFNEDESNIGRAGHKIRAFFEKRWFDVLKNQYGVVAPPPEVSLPVTTPSVESIDANINESPLLPDQDSSDSPTPEQDASGMDFEYT